MIALAHPAAKEIAATHGSWIYGSAKSANSVTSISARLGRDLRPPLGPPSLLYRNKIKHFSRQTTPAADLAFKLGEIRYSAFLSIPETESEFAKQTFLKIPQLALECQLRCKRRNTYWK